MNFCKKYSNTIGFMTMYIIGLTALLIFYPIPDFVKAMVGIGGYGIPLFAFASDYYVIRRQILSLNRIPVVKESTPLREVGPSLESQLEIQEVDHIA